MGFIRVGVQCLPYQGAVRVKIFVFTCFTLLLFQGAYTDCVTVVKTLAFKAGRSSCVCSPRVFEGLLWVLWFPLAQIHAH